MKITPVAICLVATGALLLICARAHSDTVIFANENGGSFSDGNNWSTVGKTEHRVPGGGDNACIGAGASDGQNDGCNLGPILKGPINVDGGGVGYLSVNVAQLNLSGTLSGMPFS